jgi:hypothetical protein
MYATLIQLIQLGYDNSVPARNLRRRYVRRLLMRRVL